MKDFSKIKFSKVSEYIAARGELKYNDKNTQTMLLDRVVGETEKAIAFEFQKWNATATALYSAKCWFPKNHIQKVQNDFYVNIKEEFMYIVPEWLLKAKRTEGYEI